VPIVDAYLFGHVWQAAREGAAMFAGLVFVFAIVAGAREGGEPLEASVWLRVLALQMPRVLSFTLPMALLYACVKAFSELSERGELVALSAAGQGWPRVLRAPLLLGTLAGLGALLLQEWAVPRSEQARLLVLQSAAQSRARSGFQMTHTGSTGSGDGFRQIVNARAADFARALLHAPVVKELRPDGSLRRQIVATRGQWDDRAAAMVFESGWILELPAFSIRTKDVKLQARLFERLEVRGFPPPERWSGVRTLRDMIADGQFEALSLSELQSGAGHDQQAGPFHRPPFRRAGSNADICHPRPARGAVGVRGTGADRLSTGRARATGAEHLTAGPRADGAACLFRGLADCLILRKKRCAHPAAMGVSAPFAPHWRRPRTFASHSIISLRLIFPDYQDIEE
jgi:lipopolysaccharide export LptBFGC system permease protein LptF